MEAIEFITKEQDGSIKIPKKYLSQLPKQFRVLILLDEITKKTEKKAALTKKDFSAVRIKTKGFVFNRDEANER